MHQIKEEIFVSQSKYVHDMLKKFRMENSTPIATATTHGEHICKENGEPKVNKKEYRIIVGILIFLTIIRINLQFTISLVARYMSDP